jgi:hypothetical protein
VKLFIVIILAIFLLILIRRNLLQIDLSFPLFAGLVLLGFASMSEAFIDWIAAVLSIAVAPRAIILMAIAIILGIITVLAIAHSQLRKQQFFIVRFMAKSGLLEQEARLNSDLLNKSRNTVAKNSDSS